VAKCGEDELGEILWKSSDEWSSRLSEQFDEKLEDESPDEPRCIGNQLPCGSCEVDEKLSDCVDDSDDTENDGCVEQVEREPVDEQADVPADDDGEDDPCATCLIAS
jgi:hypothetical protein